MIWIIIGGALIAGIFIFLNKKSLNKHIDYLKNKTLDEKFSRGAKAKQQYNDKKPG
jgi:hypothetical protein